VVSELLEKKNIGDILKAKYYDRKSAIRRCHRTDRVDARCVRSKNEQLTYLLTY